MVQEIIVFVIVLISFLFVIFKIIPKNAGKAKNISNCTQSHGCSGCSSLGKSTKLK